MDKHTGMLQAAESNHSSLQQRALLARQSYQTAILSHERNVKSDPQRRGSVTPSISDISAYTTVNG